MLQALSILKKPVTSDRRRTESYVFFLHYRVTFLILMFACILVSTRQFVGDRIHCRTGVQGEMSTALLDAYCWAASTYSVSSAYFKEVGVEVPHPGVGGSVHESDYIYRNYYQYIHLVLFLQALLFYLPHLIWKSIDRNHMRRYHDFINGCKAEIDGQDSARPFDAISTFIEERWGTHKVYASKYVLCELLCIFNLALQSYLMDIFLHGEFLGLGYFYSAHYNAERLKDPIRLFPLVTTCYFKKYGSSGYVDTIDALCVLPINALNVKIYLFMWVWFALLMGLSIGNLLNLGSSWFFPRYRRLLLRLRCKTVDTPCARLVEAGDYGDWLVLNCVKSNMDSVEFSRLLEDLSTKLSDKDLELTEP